MNDKYEMIVHKSPPSSSSSSSSSKNDMNLRILNQEASLQRRIFEDTDFNTQKTLPVPAERIVTVLKHSLLRMDLVASLPWLCSSLVEGNPQLEYILGPKCIRALVHLMSSQMAWREAKSGEIPSESGGSSSSSSSRTILRFHMMEGDGVSDSPKSHSSQRVEQRNEVKESRDRVKEEQDKDNNVSTFGNNIHQNQSPTRISSSPSMIIKNEKDTRQSGQNPDHLDTSKGHSKTRLPRTRTRHDKVISILKNDEAKMIFLSDLIGIGNNPPRTQPNDNLKCEEKLLNNQDEGYVREPVDALPDKKDGTSTTLEGQRQREGRNIVRLIKAALHSRYEDHVRKALKDKDSKALLCMLSLVEGNDDTSNLFTRQSSSFSRPKLREEEGRDTKYHKPTCRKLGKSTIISTLSQPERQTPEKKKEEKEEDEKEEDKIENFIKYFENLSHEDEPFSSISSSSEYGLQDIFSSNFFSRSHSSEDVSFKEYGERFLGRDEDEEEGEEEEGGWIEQEIQVETVLSRTQQMIRIPYYSHSDSNNSSSTSSSYEDDDQIVHTSKTPPLLPPPSGNSQQGLEDQEEEEEEERGRDLDDTNPFQGDDNSDLEDCRMGNGSSDEGVSPNLSSYGQTIDKEKDIYIQQNLSREEDDESWRTRDEEIQEEEEEEKSDKTSKEYWEKEVRRVYKEACNLLSQNPLAVDKILEVQRTMRRPTCTPGFQSFQTLFRALCQLMMDKLNTSMESELTRECKLREYWSNERRFLARYRKLKVELEDLEQYHVPQMLTLDFQIRILQQRLRKVSNENFEAIRNVIRDTQLNAAMAEKKEMTNVEKYQGVLKEKEENVIALKKRDNWDELRLKSIRNDLDSLLREEIAKYDEMAFKRQEKMDMIVEEKLANELVVQAIQEKFSNVKDRFIDMRATKKLRQIKKNMEMADDFKRARAAKMIQDFWRRYKIRKRRREKKKGKKGGKKKGKK